MVARNALALCAVTALLTGCTQGESESSGTRASVAPAPAMSITHKNSTAPAIVASVAFDGDTAAVPAQAKVFVFLRPLGQRMPLAVEAFRVKDLPAQLAFSRPEPALAEAEVVARLSISGAVSRHPNDPEVVHRVNLSGAEVQHISLVLRPPADAISNAALAQPLIKVRISTDGEHPQWPTNARVFLIAHDPQGATGTMPIAVRSIDQSALPVDTGLNDMHSLVSIRPLSSLRQVRIMARLAISGSASDHPKDWQSQSVNVTPGDSIRHELRLSESTR